MAIAFSRSLRSLQADRWRGTVVALLVAIVLLAAWLGWFFFASIAFGERGRVLTIDDNGFLIAEFPNTSLTKLKRGQAASILPDNSSATPSSPIPAIITDVAADDLAPGQIRLAFSSRQGQLHNPSQAQVEVILDRLSPAQLVLRHIGLTSVTLTPAANGQ